MDPTFSAPFPGTPTYAASLPAYLSPVGSVLDRLQTIRDSLALAQPGKTEELGRECKMTHLTNYIFDGARADLSKVISHNPAFQVTHSFATGAQGQGGVSPGTYNFGAVYASTQAFMQGTVDNEGGVIGRFNYGWSAEDTSKASVQLSAGAGSQSMFTLEHDRSGQDYSLSLKAYNPSPADLTGTYLASYLQSITPHIALGIEAVYQRPSPEVEECSIGYMAKWHHVTKDPLTGQQAKDSWIATAQIMSQGILSASYWRKLADRVDGGVDIMLSPAPNPRERKAIAVAGVKYDFRQATFRGQVDSSGKVAALLEHRLTPAFAFLLAGELDHAKSTSKFGVGVMIESASEDSMLEQQAAAQAAAPL